MTFILEIALKGFWCGCAATGFAVLFNAPAKTLLSVAICGCLAGLVKFFCLDPVFGVGIIPSTFVASLVVGIFGIPLAYFCRVPSVVIMLPSVIPMVPGFFAYRTMMGIMSLARNIESDHATILSQTVYNGLTTLLVIVAIAVGLLIPNLLIGTRNVEKFLMHRQVKI